MGFDSLLGCFLHVRRRTPLVVHSTPRYTRGVVIYWSGSRLLKKIKITKVAIIDHVGDARHEVRCPRLV